jgi:hypothetical protein
MATRELITPAEYARRRGVSRAAVSKAIKRCHIPLVGGKLDPLVADTLWSARTDPDQQARALGQNRHQAPESAAPLPVGPEDWRRRLEAAQAQKAELELQELQSVLVRKEAERRDGRELASGIVLHFDAMPDRIASEFGIDDGHRRKLRQRVREELDRVRDAFAGAGLLGPSDA